jgi:ribosomal protein S18 acetylase RimI-like enzyme
MKSIREDDLQGMRDLMNSLASASTIVDFDEKIQLSAVRDTLRIWKQDGKVVGFAFVDEWNNLWFDAEPGFDRLDDLEGEIIAWGAACMKKRNAETASANTLDCTCGAGHVHRRELLEKHGFELAEVRTLHYSRSLNEPLVEHPLPAGFTIRCVKGECEVEDLVALHRAAFGTNNMDVEYRLAIMRAPQYIPELDLVAVAPNGELAAFCICGFEDPALPIGYTDPIGTHPHYRRIGLGKAIVTAGLSALKSLGARNVKLGTSSENIAMQNLAADLGFVCVSEQIWFSKAVS